MDRNLCTEHSLFIHLQCGWGCKEDWEICALHFFLRSERSVKRRCGWVAMNVHGGSYTYTQTPLKLGSVVVFIQLLPLQSITCLHTALFTLYRPQHTCDWPQKSIHTQRTTSIQYTLYLLDLANSRPAYIYNVQGANMTSHSIFIIKKGKRYKPDVFSQLVN